MNFENIINIQSNCEMQEKWGLWFLIAINLLISDVLAEKVSPQRSSKHDGVFTSSFLVRFKRSVDNGEAHKIAGDHGFENLGPVSFRFSTFII